MQTAYTEQTGQPKVHLHLYPNANLSPAPFFSIQIYRHSAPSVDIPVKSLLLPLKLTFCVLAGISVALKEKISRIVKMKKKKRKKWML